MAEHRGGAHFVLAVVGRWLPEDRRAWGVAMNAELAHVHGRLARARFAVGCVRVALLPPPPDAHSKRSQFAILGIGAAVLLLALYGQHQIAANPSTGGHGVVYTSCATALGITLFAAYALIALRLARTSGPRAVASRRYGIAGGLLVGVIVLVASTPLATTAFGTRQAAVATAVSWFSLAAVSTAAAYRAARLGRDARAARDAGLWTGIIAGFVLIAGLLTVTLAATTWVTHDPAVISAYRDTLNPAHYANYRTHYATITGYAMSENSDTALLLGLIWLPLLSLAFGKLGGVIGSSHADEASRPPTRVQRSRIRAQPHHR